MKRPLFREVKEAEAAYVKALLAYGPNNMETTRKEIRWRELRELRYDRVSVAERNK